MNIDLPALREALAAAELDGWLLFDFHDANPLVRKLVGVTGMNSRRLFVLLPRDGVPIALTHAIEVDGLPDFPGTVRTYSRWQELERGLKDIVAGKRVAMEVSPENAIPYLDRVPLGVVQLLERLGATVESSSNLVARFGTRWTTQDLESHRRAAKACAEIAGAAFDFIRDQRAAGATVRETDVQTRILEAFDRGGFETEEQPIIGFGANGANPHYAPVAGSDAALAQHDVVLIDLWCKEPGGVFADQTWMGCVDEPAPRVEEVWQAVRGARDAVVADLKARIGVGTPVTGADLDDVARGVLEDAGLGEAFVHRTGHSIHHELHSIGGHLDNFETRDRRTLAPTCCFSVEPGVYFPDDFGVRSEINVLILPEGVEVTPASPQDDLIRV